MGPVTDNSNSMVARLLKIGRESDADQARAIERGISRAVQQQARQLHAMLEEGNGVAVSELAMDHPAESERQSDFEPGSGIERTWGLAELAAAALEANPATRLSWERARAAAAREQIALAAYGPDIGVEASGDLFRIPGLALEGGNAPPDTEFRFTPQIYASWLLLDFGRRDADADRARAELAAANMTHDRTIQRVVYEVQRAYFQLEAALGLRTASEQDVVAARSVLRATETRLTMGLATRPDMLIARQAFAEALYTLEKRRADVFIAEGELRTRAGFPASVSLPIHPAEEVDVPQVLAAGIDGIIDSALAHRPDLASAVLDLRAREAEVQRAQAEFMPEVVTRGTVGAGFYDYDLQGFSIQGQGWGFDGQIFLGGRWLLYDNGARESALHEANSNRAAAAARLAQTRLDAADEVWRAYYTLQSDRAQYDAAKALLVAAIDTFDAVKRAYELGLSTLPELLDAERDLFKARAQRIESRSDLLCSSASLVYASGAGPGEVSILR